MNQADGTVRAYYPGDDWFVVGTDRQDAIRLLHAEFDRRIQDPAYVAAHWERIQRHRDGLEVTPGFEVSEISRSEYPAPAPMGQPDRWLVRGVRIVGRAADPVPVPGTATRRVIG